MTGKDALAFVVRYQFAEGICDRIHIIFFVSQVKHVTPPGGILLPAVAAPKRPALIIVKLLSNLQIFCRTNSTGSLSACATRQRITAICFSQRLVMNFSRQSDSDYDRQAWMLFISVCWLLSVSSNQKSFVKSILEQFMSSSVDGGAGGLPSDGQQRSQAYPRFY